MSTSSGKRISQVADKAGRRLAVTYRPIAELKLDPNNPRDHTPRQIKQIARSIYEFGFTMPALIDADDNVIAGHGRILAALQLGLTEVPTICIEHLSKERCIPLKYGSQPLGSLSRRLGMNAPRMVKASTRITFPARLRSRPMQARSRTTEST